MTASAKCRPCCSGQTQCAAVVVCHPRITFPVPGVWLTGSEGHKCQAIGWPLQNTFERRNLGRISLTFFLPEVICSEMALLYPVLKIWSCRFSKHWKHLICNVGKSCDKFFSSLLSRLNTGLPPSSLPAQPGFCLQPPCWHCSHQGRQSPSCHISQTLLSFVVLDFWQQWSWSRAPSV